MRWHRMGVDDGGHGVGRVMDAVDEFEAEGDQEGHPSNKNGNQVMTGMPDWAISLCKL